ncbi:MAG: hypothetical protein JW778_08285 [Candidatus Altiarchaeota archaeon]|nr:hypothetical protein [Candidatus Altiarchaeota archaeon]
MESSVEKPKPLDDMSAFLRVLFYPAAFSVIFPGSIFGLAEFLASPFITALHEVGHLLFIIFGFFIQFTGVNLFKYPSYNFLVTIGGTLGQTLVPIALILYYLRKNKVSIVNSYLAFLSVSLKHAGFYCSTAVSNGSFIGINSFFIPTIFEAQEGDWYIILSYLGILDHALAVTELLYNLAYLVALLAVTSIILDYFMRALKIELSIICLYAISIALSLIMMVLTLFF